MIGYLNSNEEININNLGIVDASIEAPGYTGAIVGSLTATGSLSNVNITNCYNTGNVKSLYGPAGGLIGSSKTEGDTNIKECWNTGKVEGPAGSGGIAYSLSSGKSLNMVSCYNEGSPSKCSNSLGGLCGWCNAMSGGKIIDCYNTANIEGRCVGGLFWYIAGGDFTFTNCYNTGELISDVSCAGLVCNETGSSGGSITFSNCGNKGVISAGAEMAAGIICKGGTKFTGCANYGDIELSSGYQIGGIAAYTSGTIYNCFNSGKIIGKNASYAGGIVGYTYSSNDSNNSITLCINLGTVSGKTNAGGIARLFLCFE